VALQTNSIIKIGDITITNFSNLKIVQDIHTHNTFSVEVRQDLLVPEFKSVMPLSQRLYGEKVSIEIKPIEGIDDLMVFTHRSDYILHFSGIVTKVKTQKSRHEDLEETLFISGHSCSILLDDGLKCNSFTDKTLSDIVTEVKAGYDIDLNILPFYKNQLPYTVQYNQSTFDFLNTLAKRNAHWFYDNGRTMVFGMPGSAGGEPKLVYATNMQEFSYEMKVLPAQFQVIENDNRLGDYWKDQTLNYRNECDGFQQNFINKSNTVFSQTTEMQLNQNPIGARGKTTLEEYTKNKMRSVLANLMVVTAKSEVPGITLGNSVRITGVDVQLESSYFVTSITHLCEDEGCYENNFTAVNFNGSVFSPQTNPDLITSCKSQTAIVTANADPNGHSAVQVQMPWQESKNKTTPYIPMLQNYGGNGRGSHILPEIGDTVLVDFQGDNAELPFVIGTMSNKKEISGFSTPNNDLKVLATRSGNKLLLNDETGDITIESQKGQTIAVLCGDGNIRFKAPKNIEFEAGEDITIKAGKNFTVEAENNVTLSGGNNIILSGRNNVEINTEGTLSERGDQRILHVTEKSTLQAGEQIEMAEQIKINSTQGDITLKASQIIRGNSQEGSFFN